MSDQNRQNQKLENPKRTKKRVWLVVTIAILVAAIVVGYLLLSPPSVEEQLAAIEAARAIPDSENAATIYNKLLQDPNATSLLDYRPGFLNDDTDNLTFKEPWLSKDYPELAAWVREHQYIIDRLLEVARFEKCSFPIVIDAEQIGPQMDRFSAMRKWTYLLRRAVNNDIGEGRIDDAIDKWRCLIQMGAHLRQQPLFVEYLVAIAIEAIAINQTVAFLVEGDADDSHLQNITALPLQTKENWGAILEEVLPVEELHEQKMKENLGLLDRLKYEFGYGLFASMKDPGLDKIREIYRRKLSTSRAVHILVALRRYKNKHGAWPQCLDDIQSQVPADMLIDPFNNGSFVYKLTEDSFKLYSTGKNNIDEDGKYKGDPDDWPIWPPRGRKPKTEKEENANGK